ncbi:MAG TPA: PQQ-binding-like beta-propeller repeat protein, partial [Planctomycetota bacterium]|nr:PQQ-binding-like beta-propeller repeat protein [Planctomycetota bacterium]
KVALAKARLAAASAAAPETAPVESWPVIGGNNAHAALLPPLDGIAPQPRLACRFEGQGNAAAQRAWGTRPRSMRRFDMSYGGFTRDDVYSEMLPVAEDGKLVVTTPNSIACYAIGPQGGERLWYQGPPPPSQSGATVGAGLLWPHADLNADIYYSATIAGGRVFASYIKTMSKFDSYRGIPIQEPIATRRLLCFDLRTGKVLWDHAQSPDEFLLSASVPLPPVVRDGMVFASAILGTLRREGAFKCDLIACDAATGKLLWKRFLGSAQMELTMFGEPAREPFAMQPAERNGIVYCCSGMGTIIAASALTGDVEWEVAYDTIPIEPARTYYAVMRDLVWRNEPPLVADGTLVVTPIDSDKAYAFDAATGELRWSFDGRQTSMRRLLGVDAGKAIFQGDRILAQDIRTGKRVLEFPRDAGFGEEETGRGLICGGVALVPLSTRVARVDLRRGERLAELPIAGGIRDSGALLYLGKDLITVNPQRASVYQTISAPAAPAPAGAR